MRAACAHRFAVDRERIDAATAAVTAARLEHDAAVSSGIGVAGRAAALAAATDALAAASRPFKYVTNWCYARRGTQTLAALVRGWTETRPRAGVVCDDISAMYQNVCRVDGFATARRRTPDLLGIFRFFFFSSAVIWFGGGPVPIIATTLASGAAATVLATDPAQATGMLRSCTGGPQGCGGSTIFCINAYHETCCEAQRRNPTTDMACTADDSYLCDEITSSAAAATTPDPPAAPAGTPPSWRQRLRLAAPPPVPPGPGASAPPLFAAYACKRELARERNCLHSNVGKALLYSRAGDLSEAPDDIPGSPHHPTRPARARVMQVAGVFVGDEDACSDSTLDLITNRLAPLRRVLEMKDLPQVPNTLKHKLDLVTRVASAILNYWVGTETPSQTAAARRHSDDAVAAAVATVAATAAGPADRAAAALAQSRLPAAIGGLAASNYTATGDAIFATSPTCARAGASTPTWPRSRPPPAPRARQPPPSRRPTRTSRAPTLTRGAATPRSASASCTGSTAPPTAPSTRPSTRGAAPPSSVPTPWRSCSTTPSAHPLRATHSAR